MQLSEQDDPDARAALAANVRARPVLIVEPKPIFAAAVWAWPVLVGQELWTDTKERQDLTLPISGALDRAHAAPAPCFSSDLA